jgi:hypothetical protein
VGHARPHRRLRPRRFAGPGLDSAAGRATGCSAPSPRGSGGAVGFRGGFPAAMVCECFASCARRTFQFHESQPRRLSASSIINILLTCNMSND